MNFDDNERIISIEDHIMDSETNLSDSSLQLNEYLIAYSSFNERM